MAKRFKFKFSFPSLHFCRSKHPSTFPETPTPAIYRLSPFNPKAFDIGYPNLPAPPPSTPVSKIVSVGCGGCCRSTSCARFESSDNESHDYRLKKYGIAKAHEAKYGRKSNYEKKSIAKGSKSVSSRDSARFSSEDETETETETLLSSSRSFSDRSLQTIAENESGGFHKKKKGKRNVSMNRKGLGIGQSKTAPSPESPVARAWAVVKKSEDPYEDFKRSMWEMILERQIFEAKELEQLLQCFLSLNWPRYHGVIVAAFSEIWEVLFCDSPVNLRA